MKPYIVVLILCYIIDTVFSCKCINTSDADTYCSSDFVIHAQILEVGHVNETSKKLTFQLTKYKIKTSKVFKKSAKYVDSGFLYSAPTSCGVQLNVSKKGDNDYLFAGYVAQSKAYLHGCSWAKSWATETSDTLKNSLKNGDFDQHCPDRQIQRENEKLRNLRRQIRLNQSLISSNNSTNVRKTPKFLIF